MMSQRKLDMVGTYSTGRKQAKRMPDTIVKTTKSLLVSKNDKSSHICTMILEVVLAKYVKYGSLSIYNGCLKHF